MPEGLLDLFKFCILQGPNAALIEYITTAVAFGTFLPSNFNPICPIFRTYLPRCIVDVLVFSIIFIRAKIRGSNGYQGIPSLWKVILRDATLYFMIMMVVQLVSIIYIFGAPVGST